MIRRAGGYADPPDPLSDVAGKDEGPSPEP